MDEAQKECELAHALFTRFVFNHLRELRTSLATIKNTFNSLRDSEGSTCTFQQFTLPPKIGSMEQIEAIHERWVPGLAIVAEKHSNPAKAAELFAKADKDLLPASVLRWHDDYQAGLKKAAKAERDADKAKLAAIEDKRRAVESEAGDLLSGLDVDEDELKAKISKDKYVQ